MLRIIDNKRVDITGDEFKAYEELCKSYNRPNFEGKDLFKNLFETDEKGTIIFLRPPGKKFVSLEVITFLQNIMVHQHLRLMYDEIDSATKEIKRQSAELTTEVSDIRKRLDTLCSDVRELLSSGKESSD